LYDKLELVCQIVCKLYFCFIYDTEQSKSAKDLENKCYYRKAK